jgi:hypothetical protein
MRFITLREFFRREGFTMPQAVYLAEHGLIPGARQNPFSKKWTFEEPAELVDWLADLVREEPHAAAVAPAVAVDFGTSPHGLSVELPRPHQEIREAPSLLSLADAFKGLIEQSEVMGAFAPISEAQPVDFEAFDEEPQGAEVGLSFYDRQAVQETCCCIRKAVAKQERNLHRLRFDSVELVHLFQAVESSRKRARQAAGKGLVKVGVLRATDSLWQKLQTAMQHCHQRRSA